MEYILHYGDLEPGIVLVVDGSGTKESDRELLNVEEESHPNIISHVDFFGKEVISAYWFDGLQSSLIYRFSPSRVIADLCNRDGQGLLQSIGHYWAWASYYCTGSRNNAGKVMGLAAFGEEDTSSENVILSLAGNGRLNIDFPALRKTYKEPNVFGRDLSSSKHHQNLALKVQSETENVILKLLRIPRRSIHQIISIFLVGLL